VVADPDTPAVVTVTGARVPPTVLLAILPLPVIIVDAELEPRLVIPALFHAPAVAFVVADDGS
jgi:hypothetical protein